MTKKQLEQKIFKDATFLFIKYQASRIPEELNYWKIKPTIYMNEFINHSADILAAKPKSQFVQNIVPSFIEQYNTKGFLSKRQLEIAENLLSDVCGYGFVEGLKTAVADKQQMAMNEIQLMFGNEIESYLAEANKQYEAYKAQFARRRYYSYGRCY